jgi:hypothetical protein
MTRSTAAATPGRGCGLLRFFAADDRRRFEVGSGTQRLKSFLEVFRNSFAWISLELRACQPKLTYTDRPKALGEQLKDRL